MKYNKVKMIVAMLKQYSVDIRIAKLEKHPSRDIKTMYTQVDDYYQEWNWSDKDIRVNRGFTYEYYYWNYCLNIKQIQDFKRKAIYINIPYTHVDDDENYIEVLIFLKKDGTLTICEFDYYYASSAETTVILNQKDLIKYMKELIEYHKSNSQSKLVAS